MDLLLAIFMNSVRTSQKTYRPVNAIRETLYFCSRKSYQTHKQVLWETRRISLSMENTMYNYEYGLKG
jgi:hypothetical protein